MSEVVRPYGSVPVQPPHLNIADERKGGDNYWLVALERAIGELPCEEPSAFADITLNEEQKEYLQDYYSLYDSIHEKYCCLLESFGYKPRF